MTMSVHGKYAGPGGKAGSSGKLWARHALRSACNRFAPDLAMKGLRRDVRKARLHLIREGYSYGQAATLIGVSKEMVRSVLTGRKRSGRVVAAVMGLMKPEWLKKWEKEHAAKAAAEGGERCRQ